MRKESQSRADQRAHPRAPYFLFVLLVLIAVPLTGLADTTSHGNSQYSPTFSPGYLLACWICSSRKRNPIGGWLLYFYWQLYSGFLLSLVMLAANIQSYVPENFGNKATFLLFLLSAAPSILLLMLQCAAGTLLLSIRTWEMLKLLRWLLVSGLIAGLVGMLIDAAYFPDNVPLGLLGIVSEVVWVVYLYKSARVKHVFQTNDWATAAISLYPPKPAAAS